MMFSDQQQEIIAWRDGCLLVNAGPGSGKTRVVVARIASLVRDGIDPKGILATTFTKKAAEEMNIRLRDDGIEPSERGIAVQTMHSFCYKLMRQYGFKDWNIDEGEQYSLLVRNAVGYHMMRWRGVDVSLVESFISMAKNSLIRPEAAIHWSVLKEAPFYGDKRYVEAYFFAEENRTLKHLITFDDMLIDGVEILEKNIGARELVQRTYQYVLVDEFQDSNAAQLALVNLVSAPQWNLMVVGDTDQAIYEWRGARPEYMLTFADERNAKVIDLGVNYRCAPNIVKSAASCIAFNKERLAKDLSAHKDIDAKIIARSVVNQDEEARVIAEDIKILANDNVPYGKMFVLYRTNAQSRALEEVFASQKIPHVIIGSVSFYQRKEIQDLLAYLRVMHDPHDVRSGLRAINRPFRFINRMTLQTIEENCQQGMTFMDAAQRIPGNARVYDFLDLMRELSNTPAEESSPGKLLSAIVQKTGYLSYLTENEGSETTENSRTANIGELIRSADRFEDVGEFLKFIQWQIDQRKKKRNEREAVQCMTIHKAKGLEAEAVFVIGVNEGILPHARSLEPFEEERRLFYVAVTRAMSYLSLTCVSELGMNSMSLEPSRFLKESGIKLESLTSVPPDNTVADQRVVDADTEEF